MSKKNSKSKNSKNSLKEFYKHSSFGIAKDTIHQMWEDNKKLIYIDLVITALISIILSGYIYMIFTFKQNKDVLSALAYGLIKTPLVSIILFIVLNYYAYRYFSAIYRETLVNNDKNYDESKEGYNGTASEMNEEDRDKVFDSGNYAEITGNILGADRNNPYKLYSLNTNRYGINRNMCVVGDPGCGKSVGSALPTILQTIRRGESAIVADTKGALYKDSAAIARANGYVVKFINFNPEQSLHSDTCNYMSVIGGNIFKAQYFSKTIVDNTNDGKVADFWTNSEFNLLMGIAILINSTDWGIEQTLPGIYKFLTNNTVDDFEQKCCYLDDNHPAMPYLKTFMNGDKTVKGNTYAGLQIRLSALADPIVQRLVGIDDIDFTLPGKQKCIYYIGSPDNDTSRSYLVALFFSLIISSLINEADSQDSLHLFIRTTIILDEFANLGVIPNFPGIISQARSRWIDIIFYIQDLGQLQHLYPDDLWETILTCCYVKMLLGTSNILTSEYFSKLSGEQTTEEKSIRYEEKAGDLLKMHTNYTVTQSHGKRVVYTPAEIRNMEEDCALIFVSHQNPIKLKKIKYFNHPMCKEYREFPAKYHAPKWIKELSEKERKELGVYDEIYKEESIEDIILCTEEDFKEEWTEEKSRQRDQYVRDYYRNKYKHTSKRNNTNTEIPKDKNLSVDDVYNESSESSQDISLKYTLDLFAKKQPLDEPTSDQTNKQHLNQVTHSKVTTAETDIANDKQVINETNPMEIDNGFDPVFGFEGAFDNMPTDEEMFSSEDNNNIDLPNMENLMDFSNWEFQAQDEDDAFSSTTEPDEPSDEVLFDAFNHPDQFQKFNSQ